MRTHAQSLVSVRYMGGGVKDDPEFPLRCPRKATHSIGSGDQFLSKAARFKYNLASLHLPEMGTHLLFGCLLGNGHLSQRYFCDFQGETKYRIS